MALVGPGSSGNTRLIYLMLVSPTTIEKTFYFYKEYQPLFQQMSERLNIEFIPYLDFEIIKNLENCLLVFDDSCEAIYKEQVFVKLAVAGRLIPSKQVVAFNWFKQKTIFLFKSPQDLQQIDHFGRQLKQLDLVREAYQRATTRSFGHFLYDFHPKTSDVLRFCSNIVALQPTTFYIPRKIAFWSILETEALARKQKEERHFSRYTWLRQGTNHISLWVRLQNNQWKHTNECIQIVAIRTAIENFMSTAKAWPQTTTNYDIHQRL